MYRLHSTPYTGLAGLVEARRVRAVLTLAKVRPDDAMIEVGCEAGGLLRHAPQCKRMVGFDISKAALGAARTALRQARLRVDLVQGDAARPLPFKPGAFSLIVCSEMLEHVADPRACISAIAGLADANTRIVLSVPCEAPKLKIKAWLRKAGLLRLLMPGIEPRMSEWHLVPFDRKRLREQCDGLLSIRALRCVLGLHIVALCGREGA